MEERVRQRHALVVGFAVLLSVASIPVSELVVMHFPEAVQERYFSTAVTLAVVISSAMLAFAVVKCRDPESRHGDVDFRLNLGALFVAGCAAMSLHPVFVAVPLLPLLYLRCVDRWKRRREAGSADGDGLGADEQP